MIYINLDFLYILKTRGGWGELGWVVMTKTGPNDMSGIVWAISTCFFLSLGQDGQCITLFMVHFIYYTFKMKIFFYVYVVTSKSE